MAITRKPRAAANVSAVTEQQINRIIGKGGSAAAKDNRSDKQVLVRVPEELLEQIDALVQGRRVRMPRNSWIVEALFEKAEREAALYAIARR